MKIVACMFTILTMVTVAMAPVQAKGLKLRFEAAIYNDDKGGKLFLPEGVDCGDNYILVADTGNHRLVRYAIQNKSVSFASEIVLPRVYPLLVHLNSAGDIFVLDGKERRILRLGPAGEEKGSFEPANVPAPDTIVPKSFVIDQEDNIFVLDIFSSRILKIGSDGTFKRQVFFPENVGFISDLALTPQGDILLLDSVVGAVYKAAADGTTFSVLTEGMKDYSNFPDHLTTDSQGTIYVVDQYGSGIIILGADGSFQGRQSGMGWQESLLRYPSQVCTNNSNDLFIADRNNSRVQIFSPLEN